MELPDIRVVCGILGVFSPVGSPAPLDEDRLLALRDLLAHRGPDGAGVLTRGSVQLAHRRLAVLDLSAAGHQPIVARGRGGTAAGDDTLAPALVYNGELYNDAELRGLLESRGHGFESSCDTHTLLAALCEWGASALLRLRGMFALGFHDPVRRTLLLARDPLGIKPLYWTRHTQRGVATIAFASEPLPLLSLPWLSRRPDFVTLNAYLTTIRTTLRDRTMFEGVRTLLPGEALEFDLGTSDLAVKCVTATEPRRFVPVRGLADRLVERVREEVEASVAMHLRADVPTCCLLSGGLDSTITATLARRRLGENLHTYAAGARAVNAHEEDDLSFARLVSQSLGTRHGEAIITRDLFAERWPAMIGALGVPLSTPNEIAINQVARTLRAGGHVVAISGEGADELFAGYEAPMANAAAFFREHPHAGTRELALHLLADAAWIPSESKPGVLDEGLLRQTESDASLVAAYEQTLTDLVRDSDDDPLQITLRLLRRVNLAGLLSRLDTATMLESVEGRTPLADVGVADLAESLPMSLKFVEGAGVTGTKVCLRRAFADLVPASVLKRPKASFPLPFGTWLDSHAQVLRSSHLVRACFTTAAIETVAAHPERLFRLAWPMINLALWDRHVLDAAGPGKRP